MGSIDDQQDSLPRIVTSIALKRGAVLRSTGVYIIICVCVRCACDEAFTSKFVALFVGTLLCSENGMKLSNEFFTKIGRSSVFK